MSSFLHNNYNDPPLKELQAFCVHTLKDYWFREAESFYRQQPTLSDDIICYDDNANKRE